MVPSTAWGYRPGSEDKYETSLKEKVEVTVTEEVVEAPVAEEKPPENKMIFIDIFGPINSEKSKLVNSKLSPMTKDEDRHRLYISFSSHGGSIDQAFFIDSLLETWGEPSVAVCGSLNASAATLLIAKRDLRLAYANSRFMLHDAYYMSEGSPYEQREKLRTVEEQRGVVAEDYQKYIGISKKELERYMSRDTYFNAMDALNLGTKGLIDGIITKQLGQFKFEVLMRNNIVKVVDLFNDDFIKVKDLTVETVKNPTS